MWVTENKQNIPQVGKVTLFKSRVGKVISGQTICGFSVITLKKKMYELILMVLYLGIPTLLILNTRA